MLIIFSEKWACIKLEFSPVHLYPHFVVNEWLELSESSNSNSRKVTWNKMRLMHAEGISSQGTKTPSHIASTSEQSEYAKYVVSILHQSYIQDLDWNHLSEVVQI